MKYCFELSKEHPSLPTAEIIACFHANNIPYYIETQSQDLLIISTECKESMIKKIAQRLSHTYSVSSLLFSSPIDIKIIEQKAHENPISISGTVAIRHRNRSRSISSEPIIQSLAKIYTKERKVCLTNPDLEIRVIITDDVIYIGLLLLTIDRAQFNKRKAQHRPFFSPISLHPKLARLLVNLSEVPVAGYLLDPFCGTGGILIEAGVMGVKVIGSDIEMNMVKGCQQNLNEYGITDEHATIFQSDIGEVSQKLHRKVDAVVTDLPYGKATTTKGEDRSRLYQRAFPAISDVLKPGGKAVIGLPREQQEKHSRDYLTKVTCYPIRVHKSLTRFFYIYEK